MSLKVSYTNVSSQYEPSGGEFNSEIKGSETDRSPRNIKRNQGNQGNQGVSVN